MSIKDIIFESIDKQGIAILPSMDVFDSINLLKTEQIHIACTMLDPWYNKGKGDVLPTDEYDAFIKQLLENRRNSTSNFGYTLFP